MCQRPTACRLAVVSCLPATHLPGAGPLLSASIPLLVLPPSEASAAVELQRRLGVLPAGEASDFVRQLGVVLQYVQRRQDQAAASAAGRRAHVDPPPAVARVRQLALQLCAVCCSAGLSQTSRLLAPVLLLGLSKDEADSWDSCEASRSARRGTAPMARSAAEARQRRWAQGMPLVAHGAEVAGRRPSAAAPAVPGGSLAADMLRARLPLHWMGLCLVQLVLVMALLLRSA